MSREARDWHIWECVVGGGRQRAHLLFFFPFLDRRNERRLYTWFILWDKKKNPLKSETFVKPPQVQCCCFFSPLLRREFISEYKYQWNLCRPRKAEEVVCVSTKQTKAGEKSENKDNQEGERVRRGGGISQCIKVLYKRVNLQKKKAISPLTPIFFLSHYEKHTRTDCQSWERGHMLQHWKHFFFISSDASGTPCPKYFLSHLRKTHQLKHCRSGFSQRPASASQPCFGKRRSWVRINLDGAKWNVAGGTLEPRLPWQHLATRWRLWRKRTVISRRGGSSVSTGPFWWPAVGDWRSRWRCGSPPSTWGAQKKKFVVRTTKSLQLGTSSGTKEPC